MSLELALNRFAAAFKSRFTLPLNLKDQLLIRRNVGWEGRPVCLPLGIATDDTELLALQGATVSFADVFNNWQRISRTADDSTDNFTPSELTAWQYNSGTDRIECTVNTASLVGFLSPRRYDEYIFENIIRSTNADDDFIGVCIAHAFNPDTGLTDILTAIWGFNGAAPLRIEKNSSGFARQYPVVDVLSGLMWSDGTVADGSVVAGNTKPGWSTVPDGIKLKVERVGDIVTVSTSQYNDVDNYFAPATTVIDLSTDPELEVFRGPQRYGYVCASQVGSSWETLQIPGDRLPIVDIRDWTLWTYVSGSWVSTPSTYADLVNQSILVPHWLIASPNDKFYVVTGTGVRLL